MSRSFRKTPIFGCCSVTHGQKEFRTQENQAYRHRYKQLLHECSKGVEFTTFKYERNLPNPEAYGNEWDSPRDGKYYWARPKTDKRLWGCLIKLDWRLKHWIKGMRK